QARQCPPQLAYAFPQLDFRPLLQAVVRDRHTGRPCAEIASAFHAAVASGVVDEIARLSKEHSVTTSVLSGGVFQNEILLNAIFDIVAERAPEIRLLTNQRVPVNDGGISLGQAALALLASK